MFSRFVGIDPGVNGGMTCLRGSGGKYASTIKMPSTKRDMLDWLLQWMKHDGQPVQVFAQIEQQSPRPTSVFDRKIGQWRTTILKSTCLLWGGYESLLMALTAARMVFEECPPKRWQKALNVRSKEKGEADGKWKNVLKSKAQSLFPGHKVTLAVADSMLIAEYCRRKRQGELT